MSNVIIYGRSDLRTRGIKLSNSTLLRLEAAGRWPKRVRLGDHSVGWLASEVDAHIQKLAEERNAS